MGWIREHAPAATTEHLTKAAIAVSIVIVALAGATLYLTIQNSAQLDATRRFERAQSLSDEVSACRASYSELLVQGPTAAALKAAADKGLDSPEFFAEARKADPERFVRLAELSASDPDRFVRICRRELGS